MESLNASIRYALHIGIGIILFLGGAAVYPLVEKYVVGDAGEPQSFSSSSCSRVYDEGFSAARKLVEESSLGSLLYSEGDTAFITGKVTAFTDNHLTVHTESNPMRNPFDGPTINDRIIIIDSATKVKMLVPNPELGVSERRDNEMDISKMSIEVAGDISSIEVGDPIIVTAGENIRTLKEFTAKDIQIFPKESVK